MHIPFADPEQFALSHDGKRLYIANEDELDAVTTIVEDTEGRQADRRGRRARGPGRLADDSIAVTTSETTNMAHLIDTRTHEVIANVYSSISGRVTPSSRRTDRSCGSPPRSAGP